MSQFPCQNPNCKSFGKPHPNCRCHGGLAEGGEVAPFCSEERAHQADCEYFADGGQVEGFIPDDQFKPDAPAGDTQPEGFIPDDQFKPDDHDAQPPGFIPDAEFKPDQGNDANADLPPDELQARMVAQAHPGGPTPYESLPQQALTGLEGVAQGVAGPVATLAEKGLSKLGVPGLSDEDIVGRQEANPWEHHISEAAGLGLSALVGGPSIAAGAAKLARGAEEVANLGKIGSAAVNSAVQNGLIQGSDEVSKWMLGQGNPQDAVGSVLASGALGGLFGLGAGKIGAMADKKFEAIAERKLGEKLNGLAAGMGSAAKSPAPPSGNESLESLYNLRVPHDEALVSPAGNEEIPAGESAGIFKRGQKLHDAVLGTAAHKAASHIVGAVVGGVSAASGYGFTPGYLTGVAGTKAVQLVAPVIEKYLGSASKKYVLPITLRLLQSERATGILDTLNHAEKMVKGFDMLEHATDSLFKAGTNLGVNAYGDTKARKQLDDYINGGGVDQDIKTDLQDSGPTPDGYAEGGEVKKKDVEHQPTNIHDDGVANHFPEHNVLLSAAKGRVSGYLSSLRPQENTPRLPFDAKPDQTKQKKSYHKALDIANQPLGVLHEIHKGTIEPEHVAHLKAMYPEVDQLIQKKLTEKVMQSQLDGKKPPYRIRQGLSLLMGAPLSAEMLPQNIQAAQAVFAKTSQQQAPQGAPSKPKKSTQSLTKSDNAFLTGNQTLTARQQSKA